MEKAVPFVVVPSQVRTGDWLRERLEKSLSFLIFQDGTSEKKQDNNKNEKFALIHDLPPAIEPRPNL